MAIHRPVWLWRGVLEPDQSLPWPEDLPPAGALWLQLIDGALQAPWPLQRGDGLGLTGSAPLEAPRATADGADLLLFALV
jgi:hypothetical protein